jgi:hypothetical protein
LLRVIVLPLPDASLSVVPVPFSNEYAATGAPLCAIELPAPQNANTPAITKRAESLGLVEGSSRKYSLARSRVGGRVTSDFRKFMLPILSRLTCFAGIRSKFHATSEKQPSRATGNAATLRFLHGDSAVDSDAAA